MYSNENKNSQMTCTARSVKIPKGVGIKF